MYYLIVVFNYYSTFYLTRSGSPYVGHHVQITQSLFSVLFFIVTICLISSYLFVVNGF